MENLAKQLNISIDLTNKFWIDAYNKAILEPDVPYFISPEFVKKIQTEYCVLPENYELLLDAVCLIQEDKNLCLLAKILYHLLFLKANKTQIFLGFNFPKSQEEGKKSLAINLFLVFPILAHIPFSYEILAKKGIEKSICVASLCQLDVCISECSKQQKMPCFSQDFFISYGSFIYLKTLKIGRLRFEIAPKDYGNFMVLENKKGTKKVLVNDLVLHRSGNALGNLGYSDSRGSYVATITENDEFVQGFSIDKCTYLVDKQPTKFNKKDWKVIYRPTDDVLIVHIPPKDSFDRQSILSSYEKARQIFNSSFPEYDFKAFVTDTWLFAPALDMVLKENSNIRAFRKDYIIFPAKCLGLDVFTYVFDMTPTSILDVDIENLPENTSLRKGIKECLKKGVFFDEFYGYYKF